MPGMHLLLVAWQAHYDLKDPKGLAGFLIESDIKLVRAESGSPDESSRHRSSDMKRHEMHKMKKRQSFQLAWFFSLGVVFLFFRPQAGMVRSIVGLHSWVWFRGMLWKTRIWKVPHSAVIPGISGVCWTRMVVSLGGRKLKPWPSPMLLGHHVLHWWAMKKYKRGQMSAMTANLLSFEMWWKRHQFLQRLRHSLNFEPSKKYWKLWRS